MLVSRVSRNLEKRRQARTVDCRAQTRPVTSIERTGAGLEIEEAPGEILAHVRGPTSLPCRIVDGPAARRIVALSKRTNLSRQKFADRFGLDAQAVQDREQGRRVPDRPARILLTVIASDSETIMRVLAPAAD